MLLAHLFVDWQVLARPPLISGQVSRHCHHHCITSLHRHCNVLLFSSYLCTDCLNFKSCIRLINSYLTLAGQFFTHNQDIFLIVQINSKFSWHQPVSNKLDLSQFMLSRMLLRVWQQGFPENDDNFKFPLQNFLWSHMYIWRNLWKTLWLLSSTSVFNIRHPQPSGSVFILKW